MQCGDVLKTYAYIDDLVEVVGFRSTTSIKDGF